MKNPEEKIYGCLIGGAVGDALGAPVEFKPFDSIITRYGAQGITRYDAQTGGKITDDTQMTLFTAEGLVNAHKYFPKECKLSDKILSVYKSYLCWLITQGYEPDGITEEDKEMNKLLKVKGLYSRRAPGETCLKSLMSGKIGWTHLPLNRSKGCGGVMRAAPAGFVNWFNDEFNFKLGMDIAAITHGHPSGYLPAGVLACIIRNILDGKNLMDSINRSLELLKTKKEYDVTFLSIHTALAAYNSGDKLNWRVIEELGEGWTAEEALAIAIYCSLNAQNNFEKGVVMAVNHGGDSDSTGAITGNILGALLGIDAIPEYYQNGLELIDVIKDYADYFSRLDYNREGGEKRNEEMIL
ncbi:MAG: ADP-ribosylation/Crystallin [Ignavibacteria bacterium]|nr:ADP-ribosylation/Crystallin [Ignavibacteria bacterium]